MQVRAKFKCDSRTQMANGLCSVSLTPVHEGSEENKQFWKWTPGGKIDLYTINAEAAAAFEPGEEYYIDFTPAPKKEG